MPYQKVGFWRLLVLVALIGYLGGQVLHESGHWAVLQLFGRGSVMSFTGLVQRDEPPANPEAWVTFTAPDGEQVWLHLTSLPASRAEWLLMAAAGPLAQLIAMIVGLLLAHFARREVVSGHKPPRPPRSRGGSRQMETRALQSTIRVTRDVGAADSPPLRVSVSPRP